MCLLLVRAVGRGSASAVDVGGQWVAIGVFEPVAPGVVDEVVYKLWLEWVLMDVAKEGEEI